MKRMEKIIMLSIIICILIFIGIYLNADNPNDTISDYMNDDAINESIFNKNNSNKDGTIWLEENGRLNEVNVSEASGSISASS